VSKICDYECGQEAKYSLKNGKWCCESHFSKCPVQKKKRSDRAKGTTRSKETRKKMRDINIGKTLSEKTRNKISKSNKGQKRTKEFRIKMSKIMEGNINSPRRTIEYLNNKYKLFSKVEEIREHPKTREVQFRCKNHNCINSKERGGWFTPTGRQLEARIFALEHPNGNDCQYLYCSEICKKTCDLFNLRSDPFKNDKLPYTLREYQVFREEVLRRDNYQCLYCGESATDVHHTRPIKLEPFFSLDPDYAISFCEECHYKYGHKTGTYCSTGQLANKICINKHRS